MTAGEIGQRGDVLISAAIGLWALYMGAKTKTTQPDKTVNLGKPFPLHLVFTVAGAVVLLTAIVRFFAP
jgi:hypothetical protein